MPMMKETTLTRRAEHCGCRECCWLKANKISAHPEKATLITELKEPLRKLMLKHSKPSWVWADVRAERLEPKRGTVMMLTYRWD